MKVRAPPLAYGDGRTETASRASNTFSSFYTRAAGAASQDRLFYRLRLTLSSCVPYPTKSPQQPAVNPTFLLAWDVDFISTITHLDCMVINEGNDQQIRQIFSSTRYYFLCLEPSSQCYTMLWAKWKYKFWSIKNIQEI